MAYILENLEMSKLTYILGHFFYHCLTVEPVQVGVGPVFCCSNSTMAAQNTISKFAMTCILLF
jgi:hypothetical protein